MDSPWHPSENARWTLPGIHQRMLRWTPVAPFPRPAFEIYTFSELRFVEADIGFLAGTPTIIRLEISITRTKQACEFPAAYTVVHFVLLLL